MRKNIIKITSKSSLVLIYSQTAAGGHGPQTKDNKSLTVDM